MQEGETIKERVKKDVNYINKEIIAEQVDGRYCKFSRLLNEVAYTRMSKEQYFAYWTKQYKKYPKELALIIKACTNKFDNTLVSRDKMIQLIRDGKDTLKSKQKYIEDIISINSDKEALFELEEGDD